MPNAPSFCHARRKLFDVFEATGSPIAQEAPRRIAGLYAIEADITGQPAAIRLAIRQERALPVLQAFHPWLEEPVIFLAN